MWFLGVRYIRDDAISMTSCHSSSNSSRSSSNSSKGISSSGTCHEVNTRGGIWWGSVVTFPISNEMVLWLYSIIVLVWAIAWRVVALIVPMLVYNAMRLNASWSNWPISLLSLVAFLTADYYFSTICYGGISSNSWGNSDSKYLLVVADYL
jgi:hypothetical protein